MGSLLRFFFILFCIWLVLRWRRQPTQRQPRDAQAQQPQSATEMLPCAHCGTYIPESEIFRAENKTYCSRQHLLAAQKR